jgi:putative membrane protein
MWWEKAPMGKDRGHPRLCTGLDIVTLMFWSGGLLFLLNGERFKYFLRPAFAIGLFAALLMCVVCIIALIKTATHESGVSPVMRLVRASVLILPLVYAVAAGKSVLDSQAFATRWTLPPSKESAAPRTSAQASDIPASSDDDDAELIEAYRKSGLTPSLYDLVQFGDRYAGKRVTTEGMAAWDKEKADRFYLFRFVIVCCVADAQPAAVLVECSNRRRPAQNTWVRVEGQVEIVGAKGHEDLLIRHSSFVPIRPPKEPYLY